MSKDILDVREDLHYNQSLMQCTQILVSSKTLTEENLKACVKLACEMIKNAEKKQEVALLECLSHIKRQKKLFEAIIKFKRELEEVFHDTES